MTNTINLTYVGHVDVLTFTLADLLKDKQQWCETCQLPIALCQGIKYEQYIIHRTT
jgi:hypothetical protein